MRFQGMVGQCWGRTSKRKMGLSQEIKVPVPHSPPQPHLNTHTRACMQGKVMSLCLPAVAEGPAIPPGSS